MRVLVVDDSTLYRKIVRDALGDLERVEIVGVARDGREALEKIRDLQPDLVTLDQEMPRLDGLGVLQTLQSMEHPPIVVMISALTAVGAEVTAQALRSGAFDFVLKPEGDSLEDNRAALREGLRKVLGAAREACVQRQEVGPPFAAAAAATSLPVAKPPGALQLPPGRAPLATAIGISTGGPAALSELLPQLPASYPMPLLIVQHMPPFFTRSLADQLDQQCRLRVCEASHGDVCLPGTAYIAPGGRQMRVAWKKPQLIIELTDDPEERSCRPSADYLFRSLALSVGGRAIGLIMTGMGDDGAAGCELLKRAGARIIAQDEASCVVFGMPRRVVEEGLADVVAPLGQIASILVQTVECEALPCS